MEEEAGVEAGSDLESPAVHSYPTQTPITVSQGPLALSLLLEPRL